MRPLERTHLELKYTAIVAKWTIQVDHVHHDTELDTSSSNKRCCLKARSHKCDKNFQR